MDLLYPRISRAEDTRNSLENYFFLNGSNNEVESDRRRMSFSFF